MEKDETKERANKTAIIKLKLIFEGIAEIFVKTAVIR
ncbi:MAG: hypothetical protein ACD_12C00563G0003 [uncultured bacterium]|nr:MAG: hypothetical protein ACD_12C00563G0003 [uncultured bacterium]